MKTFNSIVSEIFHIDEKEIRDELSPKDIPGWDSMNYLLFIGELEKEFNMTFSMNEVMDSETLGEIKKIVDSKKK